MHKSAGRAAPVLAGDLDREAASGNTSTPAHVQAGERERERERERDVGAVSSASRGSSLRSSTPRPPPAGSRTLPVHDFPDHPWTGRRRSPATVQTHCTRRPSEGALDLPRLRSITPRRRPSQTNVHGRPLRAQPARTCVRSSACGRNAGSQTLDPARSGRVCSWLHSVCTPGVQTECAGRGRVCRGCAPNVHGSTSFRGAWPRNVYPWTRRGRGCRRRVHQLSSGAVSCAGSRGETPSPSAGRARRCVAAT